MHSLEQNYQLAKIGPRVEEIARAKGAVMQADGQAAYAKSQLDATVIRARRCKAYNLPVSTCACLSNKMPCSAADNIAHDHVRKQLYFSLKNDSLSVLHTLQTGAGRHKGSPMSTILFNELKVSPDVLSDFPIAESSFSLDRVSRSNSKN